MINDLDVLPDVENLTYEEYKKLWGGMKPIQIRMIEKNEKCKHNLGDKFIYKNPYEKP